MPRVLVFDDDPLVRASISVALKARDFKAVTAESGAAGLDHQEVARANPISADYCHFRRVT
jgi:DNA-binding response OmpR family regulator